jgi:hypothetical protein
MSTVPEPVTASPQAGARLPDFFIVGHAKSGTTALYEMLRRHPQIYLPELKEPWFFSTDMYPRFKPKLGGLPPATLAEYLRLFAAAPPQARAGEASSSYLWSQTAAAGIAQVQPRAKIIAILREPASFLRSLHLQLRETHVESQRSLRKALALEAARREGRRIPRRSHRPQLLQYAELVRYTEQLRRYEELFAPEQLLVLIYEDFRADNEGTVRKVLRFLDVDDTVPIDVLNANATIALRSQGLNEFMHAVSVGHGPLSHGAKQLLKALSARRLRYRGLAFAQRHLIRGAPAPPDEALMLELRRRFKPEVVAASEHLGRDLVTLWGYDRIV